MSDTTSTIVAWVAMLAPVAWLGYLMWLHWGDGEDQT